MDSLSLDSLSLDSPSRAESHRSPKVARSVPTTSSRTIASTEGRVTRHRTPARQAGEAEVLRHGSAVGLLPRVLVICDDDDLLQMSRAILGADGYLVDTAYAGLDGLHKALRFPPDVILLDVLMSGCDGLEIFDTLRQHERTAHVPVLALSMLAGRDASRLLLNVGFSALIEKPVDWPVLRGELRRRVGNRAL